MLVGIPHVAYFIALEWVGKVLVSPVSAPFFVGSAAYAAAAAALPDELFETPFELDAALEWQTPEQEPARNRVAWSIAGGVFRKIVRGDLRSGAEFAAMARAYKHLGALLSEQRPANVHLVAYANLFTEPTRCSSRCRLWPATRPRRTSSSTSLRERGRSAWRRRLQWPGAASASSLKVAATVVWLARRCLLYVDLRAPNVMISEEDGSAWLVDFDDCIVTSEPVMTLEAFRAALSCTPAASEMDTFATRFLAGGGAINEAIASAFLAEPSL